VDNCGEHTVVIASCSEQFQLKEQGMLNDFKPIISVGIL
jgi:hypothetical protein